MPPRKMARSSARAVRPTPPRCRQAGQERAAFILFRFLGCPLIYRHRCDRACGISAGVIDASRRHLYLQVIHGLRRTSGPQRNDADNMGWMVVVVEDDRQRLLDGAAT